MGLASRTLLLAAAGSCAVALSPTAASAVTLPATPTACSTGNLTTTGTVADCRGWYQGNLNSGNSTDLATEAAILNDLLGVNTFTAANLQFTDITTAVGSNVVNFASPITGTVVLGVHVGQGSGIGYNGTGFFELVNPGSSVTLNFQGLSNARLFSVAAVPEASTWAMMLLGLGSIGFLLRRNRQQAARRGTTVVTYKGLMA